MVTVQIPGIWSIVYDAPDGTQQRVDIHFALPSPNHDPVITVPGNNTIHLHGEIVTGSAKVEIDGKPAARVGDLVNLGHWLGMLLSGKIVTGSNKVLVE